MLLQIQAPRPIFIPPPQIGEALANIAGLVRHVIDPSRQKREAFQQFLLENPDLAAAFASQQEVKEKEAEAEITAPLLGPGEVEAPAGVPVGIPEVTAAEPAEEAAAAARAPVNVLEGYGFSPEQARETLAPFKGLAGTRDILIQAQEAEAYAAMTEAQKNRIISQLAIDSGNLQVMSNIETIQLQRQQMEERVGLAFSNQYWSDTTRLLRAEGDSPESVAMRAEGNRRMMSHVAPGALADLRIGQELILRERELTLDNMRANIARATNEVQAEAARLQARIQASQELRALDEIIFDPATTDEHLAATIVGANSLRAFEASLKPGQPTVEFILEDGKRAKVVIDPLGLVGIQREAWYRAMGDAAVAGGRSGEPGGQRWVEYRDEMLAAESTRAFLAGLTEAQRAAFNNQLMAAFTAGGTPEELARRPREEVPVAERAEGVTVGGQPIRRGPDVVAAVGRAFRTVFRGIRAQVVARVQTIPPAIDRALVARGVSDEARSALLSNDEFITAVRDKLLATPEMSINDAISEVWRELPVEVK